jgi:glyoxylase-like metal-dependent hydrolase (beta-lactamase superfamily II)
LLTFSIGRLHHCLLCRKHKAISFQSETISLEITPGETTRLLGDKDMVATYDDSFYIGHWFREMRHSPCFMAPLSLFFFFIFGIFAFLNMMIAFPGLILGLILSPILQRNSWYVEFLYPWNIARWGHLLLISRSSRLGKATGKNRGFHSRAIEQRIEVIPGRVYIHPIPQWLDNVGYLVVCLPTPPKKERNQSAMITIDESTTDQIVALLVDCGEAEAVVGAVELIQDFHYGKKKIEIQSILSTHKHHDHTGGNGELLAHKMGRKIKRVFGGAVERVPHCTDFLTNGELLTLPHSQSNDMNQSIEIEAIAVPAHTRGSLVYRLSAKMLGTTEFLFTGDTIFSGGGGVPFEADIGQETEKQLSKSSGSTFFRGGIGSIATERCFSEIIARTMPNDNSVESGDRILIFPGHEYTADLLSRQFQSNIEACRWRLFSPKDFFETASQMYVALHRRSLPHNTGKLLCIPSTLSREVYINPNFRSLKRTGEMVVRAINFWYEHFCLVKVSTPLRIDKKYKKTGKIVSSKTPSDTRSWTMDASNFNRDVFTTIYTADLESVIEQLSSGKLGKKEGAAKLNEIAKRLSEPVVNKRAIPGLLPSDKNIWKGISGLARLGSGASAMSLSDSRNMKLPPPIDSNSDRILVSINRLLLVLGRLGLLQTEDDDDITHKVKQLWTEASAHIKDEDADTEWVGKWDEIELGVLKWTLYGVPSNQPSWFSKAFCMPCSNANKPRIYPEHPADHMKQKSGELVSHDVYTCLLCRNATGCMEVDGMDQEQTPELEETPSDEQMELSINVGDDIDEPEISETAAHEILSHHEEEGTEIPLDEFAPPQHYEQNLAAQEAVSDIEDATEIPLDELVPPQQHEQKLVAQEAVSDDEQGREIPHDELAPPQHHEPKLGAQETVSDDEQGREMPLDELAHHLSLKEHNM